MRLDLSYTLGFETLILRNVALAEEGQAHEK